MKLFSKLFGTGDIQINEMSQRADEYFSKGMEYLNSSDYVNAVKFFRRAGELGNVYAQHNMGVCFHHGNGVEQSYSKAVEWYLKAAKQGYAKAQGAMGYHYESGSGVEQNYSKAAEWYLKAANQGDVIAQNKLGYWYCTGKGVPQNYKKALEWYKRAANQGDAEAQYNVGICYANGEGTPRDIKEALTWWKKAAMQGYKQAEEAMSKEINKVSINFFNSCQQAANRGDAEAQYQLGNCYSSGLGVHKNLKEALIWWEKAALQGHKGAIKEINKNL